LEALDEERRQVGQGRKRSRAQLSAAAGKPSFVQHRVPQLMP
jgi:hypothetical protein